jgi:hypothetical protein
LIIAIPGGYAHFEPIHSTIKLIEFEVFVLPISWGKWKVVKKRNLETPELNPTTFICFEE